MREFHNLKAWQQHFKLDPARYVGLKHYRFGNFVVVISDGVLAYGAAICSPVDSYNSKHGFQRAYGRALKMLYLTVPQPENPKWRHAKMLSGYRDNGLCHGTFSVDVDKSNRENAVDAVYDWQRQWQRLGTD